MIPYEKTFIGISTVFRVDGSPLYRAAIPGLISVALFIFLDSVHDNSDDSYLEHPYGVGVLISSISLLIVFRANHGYQRYWNACGDVHNMVSRWLDAATHTGVYHLQQSHYDCIKPPSYFDNHALNKLNLTRDRDRNFLSDAQMEQTYLRRRRNFSQSIVALEIPQSQTEETTEESETVSIDQLLDGGGLDGGWTNLFGDGKSTFCNNDENDSRNRGKERGFAHHTDRTPSLFLQELVHLSSLCSAVALSTLRNDADGDQSFFDIYNAGADFPEVDPGKLPRKVRKQIESWSALRYLFGLDRSRESRTRYNTLRPLPVLGGVSANEIAFLKKAKGSLAKTTLAFNWLSEFIIRENLAGSLGKVGSPTISRVMQFLGDGMLYYNQCRKTAFIPLPYPKAQLAAFFVLSIIVIVPILMYEFTKNIWVGSGLTFLTVTCLAGLHEVSRELENPFKNIPNEIPLVTFQAMFNESLITLYSGYHPDHFWDPDQYIDQSEVPVSCEIKSRREEKQENEKIDQSELVNLVIKQSKQIELLCKKLESLSERPQISSFESLSDTSI